MHRLINDLAKLPPKERAAFYRRSAMQAKAAAQRAVTPESRASYLDLSDAWLTLAGQVLDDEAFGQGLTSAPETIARLVYRAGKSI